MSAIERAREPRSQSARVESGDCDARYSDGTEPQVSRKQEAGSRRSGDWRCVHRTSRLSTLEQTHIRRPCVERRATLGHSVLAPNASRTASSASRVPGQNVRRARETSAGGRGPGVGCRDWSTLHRGPPSARIYAGRRALARRKHFLAVDELEASRAPCAVYRVPCALCGRTHRTSAS